MKPSYVAGSPRYDETAMIRDHTKPGPCLRARFAGAHDETPIPGLLFPSQPLINSIENDSSRASFLAVPRPKPAEKRTGRPYGFLFVSILGCPAERFARCENIAGKRNRFEVARRCACDQRFEGVLLGELKKPHQHA